MPKAKVKKSKWIFLFLRLAVVTCGIIWGTIWIRREVGWDNLAETFRKINLGVFTLALGIFVISQVIIGFRWWLLLRAQSIFIGFWAAVRLHFLGLFYNNFMPSSVGGDLIRAWYVTRYTDKRFEAALSVFVDRAIGLLSTLIIAAFFYSLFLRGKGSVITRGDESDGGFLRLAAKYKGIVFWVVVGIAVIFSLFFLHKQGRKILLSGWSYFRMLSVRGFRKLKDAIILYRSNPLTILAVFGLTVFLQILTITGFWFVGLDIGITASIKFYYVFFTLTWVLGAVPISIGGAVVVEGLLIYMFIHFAGVDKNLASTLAISQRAVWMLASLPGAAIHLIGAHLPGDPKCDKKRLGTPKDFFC